LRSFLIILSFFLFSSASLANKADDVAIKQLILILQLEELHRLHNKNLPPIPRVKPPVPFKALTPRFRPAHPLTTYRNVYDYIVRPHNPTKQLWVPGCYSVGINKYGYLIKTPCKKE